MLQEFKRSDNWQSLTSIYHLNQKINVDIFDRTCHQSKSTDAKALDHYPNFVNSNVKCSIIHLENHISFLKCPLLKILELKNEISSLVCHWIKIISSLMTGLRLVTCDEMILIQPQTRDDISLFLNSRIFINSIFVWRKKKFNRLLKVGVGK